MNFEEYERVRRADYEMLAKTVATILTAAINANPVYRLQQVTARAKQAESLKKKLATREISGTATLENEIKDLAGCRIIFYTNGDVSRFINSGIIFDNFDVLEAKVHNPTRTAADATEFFISNHYLVRFRPERLAMPEYSKFGDMRCEIQIQTILNHAWAEMAHDTIYKAPNLDNFGLRAFDGIKSRMQRVAQKYLLPAGYEFQQIVVDFERLMAGKDLFDGNALEAIVDAKDNNVRAAALETFTENVLPLYDDVRTLYSEIVKKLVVAAQRASKETPVPIDTPYGSLPAKTFTDILKAILKIFVRYRYSDVELTFNGLRSLYVLTTVDLERKSVLDAAEALAKHELSIWRRHGPVVQEILVNLIDAIDSGERTELQLLDTRVLSEILGMEISGTTSSSNAVTLHRASVTASDTLGQIRTKAIQLLKSQFTFAVDDKERRAVLLALQSGTHRPMGTNYSNALLQQVMEDTRNVLDFEASIAPTLSFDLLQTLEAWVHRLYWTYSKLPESIKDDVTLIALRAQVQASAISFRDAANANQDFVIYKTLVGYNSVFPPAWESQEFGYKLETEYREAQVTALLATFDSNDAELWLDRISRYAQTESSDAATFPVFGNFLERLATDHPAVVLGYIDLSNKSLTNFLPVMLLGLMRSEAQKQTRSRIEEWLESGTQIGRIAWYLRFANPFDETLLQLTLASALKHSDEQALTNVVLAAASQYELHAGTLTDNILIPAVLRLSSLENFSWIYHTWVSWLDSPIICSLNVQQGEIILNALVRCVSIESNSEYIVASIAKRSPAIALAFFGKRLALACCEDAPQGYDAIPFEVHQLKAPLANAPGEVLKSARAWFDEDAQNFRFNGGRLLASVFDGLPDELSNLLTAIINDGTEADLAFVLCVLSAFEGIPRVYDLVRTIVARLAPQSELLRNAESALIESGSVSGEFGFAELHAERKAMLETWLEDPKEVVRTFAQRQIFDLSQMIAAETRSAAASIAMRKLEYGEELDSK